MDSLNLWLRLIVIFSFYIRSLIRANIDIADDFAADYGSADPILVQVRKIYSNTSILQRNQIIVNIVYTCDRLLLFYRI
jgi:hypothetical protein